MGHVIERNYVEDSIPGLDNNFIEFTFSIPPESRLHYKIYKRFLKSLSPELASIPYQLTMIRPDTPWIVWELGRIYQGITYRTKNKLTQFTNGKISFPNKRSWIRVNDWIRFNNKWSNMVDDLLCKKDIMLKEYCNTESIKNIVENHRLGIEDNSRLIVLLSTFELFLRLFAF
jgi:asparagine synthetase B (glutamine-hydrolysing)